MRYRRETDTVAVVLLLVAAWLGFVAWWTALRAERPPAPRGLSLSEAALEAWTRAEVAFEAQETARATPSPR